MALVSRARARFNFFGTLALALAHAPEKSSALAFNSGFGKQVRDWLNYGST